MLNVVKRVDATTSTPSSPMLTDAVEPLVNSSKSTISVGTQISSPQLSPNCGNSNMSSVSVATATIVDLLNLKEMRPVNNVSHFKFIIFILSRKRSNKF